MRRKQRASADEDAWELLRGARSYQLAMVGGEGEPILRTMDGVVVDDWLLFHGAFAGEKSEGVGQACVASAHDVVALIPSHFVDPQKACPATTYYRSVQVKGRLCDVKDEHLKRGMLQGLMQKSQPEGGYVSFFDGSDLYKKDLRATRVFGFKIEEITGKSNLGQDRPVERTRGIVEKLFQRGAPGDMQAIETILRLSPEARPESMQADPFTLIVSPNHAQIQAHAQLLEGQYWRLASSQKQIEVSIENSSAWVGALDDQHRLVGAARAIADKYWTARISDVVVAPHVRGRGLGKNLTKLLLAHPLVRDCATQRLGTRDAMEFYRNFGFQTENEMRKETNTVAMIKRLTGTNGSLISIPPADPN